MKSLVFVAYFFPPTGGAGVQRTVKFVRYLPDYGWEPAIVTGRGSHSWMQDPSLGEEIPHETRVVRTAAPTGLALLRKIGGRGAAGTTNARRSGSLQRSLRRVSGFLAVPDPYVGWVPFAARASIRLLREGGVLMTTSSPDSAHLTGLLVARRAGCPWVADFRDPWVRRMSYAPPTGAHRRLHERLEAAVVASASRIVVTSDATRDDFLSRYPALAPERIACIPNGYDEEDFVGPDPAPAEGFRLLHLGQLNPERPIGPLLDHLDAFLALHPEARGATRVDLVGPRYAEDEAEVARRGLGDLVRFEEALPHRSAVDRLRSATVLVLMEQESLRGSLIIPGKTFEYLRSTRPILALVPPGAAWDLVTGLEAGPCVRPSDPRGGAQALARLYAAWKSGEGPAGANPERIAPYERRVLTRRLAALLDSLL